MFVIPALRRTWDRTKKVSLGYIMSFTSAKIKSEAYLQKGKRKIIICTSI